MSTRILATAKPHQLPVLRGLVPIIISLSLLWLLRNEFATFDMHTVIGAVFTYTVTQWVTAAGLVIISFYAVAQYDRLAGIELGLAIPNPALLRAGWRATAIGQVLGYGLITGTLVRWRALSKSNGADLWACTRLTGTVTALFFAGWAVVVCFTLLISPPAGMPVATQRIASMGMVLLFGLITLSFLPRPLLRLPLPAPRVILPTIGYTALDTLAACAIIFLFLPEGYVPFYTLFSAFLLSLAAGMMSGLPGGAGAFDLCLVGLIGAVDPAPLMTAILAYRLIYYAMPALVAGLSLLRLPAQLAPSKQFDTLIRLPSSFAAHSPPEAQLLALGQVSLRVDSNHRTAALWHRARNCDIVLGDPFGTKKNQLFLQSLYRDAKLAGRGLCIYKASEDIAAEGRALGWSAFKIGSEAVISTEYFKADGPQYRQLRRKLRKAEKAGVEISEGQLPWQHIAFLDEKWQMRNGRAKGFSMGYVDPAFISQQAMFIAHHNGRPVGFVTFLLAHDKWTLDIIRSDETCPDGTIHALVCAAIGTAKSHGVSEVSLAAAPGYLEKPVSLSDRFVQAIFGRRMDLKGLAQFKSSFAPDWRPYHVVASSPFALIGAVCDIWGLIHWPPNDTPTTASTSHNDYRFYEFASSDETCHARKRMT